MSQKYRMQDIEETNYIEQQNNVESCGIWIKTRSEQLKYNDCNIYSISGLTANMCNLAK